MNNCPCQSSNVLCDVLVMLIKISSSSLIFFLMKLEFSLFMVRIECMQFVLEAEVPRNYLL